jgi:sigma-E factor negative regulatory protein RseA
MNEKISALMDGELSDFEARRLLQEISRDPQQRATWERYHLVRASLRNELPAPLASGMAGRVEKRLAEESVLSGRPARLSRYAGTLAVAATVAAVSILGVQWLQSPEPAKQSVAVKSDATPVSAQKSVVAAKTTRWNTNQPETESALNAYLVEHNAFAATGVGGLLPYVRVVGHDTEK